MRWEKGFALLGWLSAAGFMIAYHISPWITDPSLAHPLPFLCFGLLLSAFSSFGLAWFFSAKTPSAVPQVSPVHFRPHSAIVACFFLLAVAVVIRVLGQIDAPLHWEDNFHFSNVVNSPWERFNPLLRTEHHPLTNLAAYLSVNLFGMSKEAIKFPAICFTLFLLSLVLWQSHHRLSRFTALLILVHLALNQMTVWYMHSMRAYILAMGISFAAYTLTQTMTQRIPPHPRRTLVALGLLSYAAVFTHLFATLFSVLLFVTLLVWSLVHLRELTEAQRKFIGRWFLIFLGFVVPVYLFILFHQAMWLERLGDLFQGGFPDLSSTLLGAVGSSFSWSGRLTVVLIAALLVRLMVDDPQWLTDFSSLFVGISVLFFSSILWVLQVRLIETRFILPFLVPVLLWVGESVSRLRAKPSRWLAMGVAALVFWIVPWQSAKGIYSGLSLNVKDFDEFIQTVQKITQPLRENCYTFSGEPNLVYFSQSLYLGKYQGVGTKANCKVHYHLYFESPKDLAPIDTRSDHSGRYEVVYQLGSRMILSRKVPDSLFLSQQVPDGDSK
jgi:hypothetical protein